MKKQERERKQEQEGINIDYLTEEDLSNDSEIDKAASKEKQSLYKILFFRGCSNKEYRCNII